MKSRPWLRLYTDILDDEKLGLLAFEDRWHFIAILACKGRGLLDRNEQHDLMRRKIALKLGLATRELDEVARRLSDVGLIDRETLQPNAWNERQFLSDTSTDRVRAYRERQTQKARNTDETFQERPKSTDTDTDKETEEETVTSFKGRGGNFPSDAPPSAASPPPSPAADALSEQVASQPSKASRTSATRLPADWRLPKSWGQWALEERPDLSADDVRREAEIFTDYWHAKAGADARKANWEATWRNWVRRADGRGTAPRRGAGGQAIDPHAPVETYAQRAARQRVEEVAPGAARKAPGQRSGFEMAQAFMHGADVIDVVATARPQQRISGGV